MQDYEAADCPMSEPFRAKIGITVFLACLFYQGFITRIIFAPPHLRSVTNALIPPSAFLIGGGILPALIGYMGKIYTFAAGITIAGAFMLMGHVLVYFLKLGQYDDQAGC